MGKEDVLQDALFESSGVIHDVIRHLLDDLMLTLVDKTTEQESVLLKVLCQVQSQMAFRYPAIIRAIEAQHKIQMTLDVVLQGPGRHRAVIHPQQKAQNRSQLEPCCAALPQ